MWRNGNRRDLGRCLNLFGFGARAHCPLDSREFVLLEKHADALLLSLTVAILHEVDIVPAIKMEGIGEQGSTQEKADLTLRHAWTELVYGLLREHIALLDVDSVGEGEPGIPAATPGDESCAQQGINEKLSHVRAIGGQFRTARMIA